MEASKLEGIASEESGGQWTWVWVDSGSWWWTGRRGMMRFMRSQRVRHDRVNELNWTDSPLNSPPIHLAEGDHQRPGFVLVSVEGRLALTWKVYREKILDIVLCSRWVIEPVLDLFQERDWGREERKRARERKGGRQGKEERGGELFPESAGQVFPFLSFWRKNGGALYYCQSCLFPWAEVRKGGYSVTRVCRLDPCLSSHRIPTTGICTHFEFHPWLLPHNYHNNPENQYFYPFYQWENNPREMLELAPGLMGRCCCLI